MNNTLALKVCGMKDADNIKALIENIAPDFIGFIFYKKSPRYGVTLAAAKLIDELAPSILKVGVFVNETIEEILAIKEVYNLQAIQLHGNEISTFCEALKKDSIVIKAFGIDEHFNFESLNAYKNAVDYFLFDTKVPQHGGSGTAFDWAILNQYQLDIPYFLSGGISMANISDLKVLNKKPYALDVNSKFELSPGLKDIAQLQLLKEKIVNYV
jgi:phosphoribosylanthranilate isomerase